MWVWRIHGYKVFKLASTLIQSHFTRERQYLDTNAFAWVSWPMHHPMQHSIGKPFEIWCRSLYESGAEECILPLDNIVSLVLTAQYV